MIPDELNPSELPKSRSCFAGLSHPLQRARQSKLRRRMKCIQLQCPSNSAIAPPFCRDCGKSLPSSQCESASSGSRSSTFPIASIAARLFDSFRYASARLFVNEPEQNTQNLEAGFVTHHAIA
jgi:hypothetical protein